MPQNPFFGHKFASYCRTSFSVIFQQIMMGLEAYFISENSTLQHYQLAFLDFCLG